MKRLSDFVRIQYDSFGARFMLALLEPASLTDLEREEGQTLAEYALILAMIAVVVVAVVATLGGKIKGIFTSVNSSI